MSTLTENPWLPPLTLARPEDHAAVVEQLRSAHAAEQAVYPLGGGTALGYGAVAEKPGLGLQMGAMSRVIEYPARDMTITVETGITLAKLAETLAGERQQLPIDVPFSDTATLGGLLATNHSGPRRFGSGTARDYVIGITAVDGRGETFKGGGRVVKNVAGYDFCKLLVGSLGSIGVITQATLKVRPAPQASALLVCPVREWLHAERMLAGLTRTRVTPAAIELIAGAAWQEFPGYTSGAVASLVVGLEGTEVEVRWMLDQLTTELATDSATRSGELCRITGQEAASAWKLLTETSASGDWPLVLEARLLPSRLTPWLSTLAEQGWPCSWQAHAGDGIVSVTLAEPPASGAAAIVAGGLGRAAREAGGSLRVLASQQPTDLTRELVWGDLGPAGLWMAKVKQQFDPKNLLNPGRML